MGALHWTEPGALERHCWRDDGQLRFAAKQTIDGRTTYRTFIVDTHTLGLVPGGWLSEAVDAAPSQLHFVQAAPVTKTLVALAQSGEVLNLLNTEVKQLLEEDVVTVLAAVDAYHAVRSRFPVSVTYAQTSRHFLLKPVSAIGNGTLLCDVEYKTALTRPSPKANDTLSDRPHPTLQDSDLAAPAGALEFADMAELERKQLAHFTGRIEILVSSCVGVLDAHDSIVNCINETRNSGGLDDLIHPKTRTALKSGTAYKQHKPKNIHESAQLALAINMLQTHELCRPNDQVKLELTEITQFAPLLIRNTYEERFSVLLSEYYLSRTIIIACFVILMLSTGWNKSTVLTLSIDRVQKIPNGYKLSGLKARSGQNETDIVDANVDTGRMPYTSASPIKTQNLLDRGKHSR
ncbi:hypothetical protein [Paraburkholderia sp. 40]|uniref:hypothetical protein n=1 Tax=Paraburkholderia sp. 40 TaxID=2991059 RepID=UPI003D1E2A50